MATKKKRVAITLTDEQFAMVENVAKNRGLSKTAIFILALEDYAKKMNFERKG